MFCREYVIDFNAARASRAAGYSKSTSEGQATLNLSSINCIAFIGELLQGMHKRQALTVDDIRRRYEQIVTVDRRALVDEEGKYKGLHELDDEVAQLVEGYKISNKGVEVKLVSRRQALRDLGEMHAMFRQVTEVLDSRRGILTDEERAAIDPGLDQLI